jgi:short-subunit dehydrogenase
VEKAKKNCLVIGGGSDIGGAIVRQLHKAGHNVVSTYHKSVKQAERLPGKIIKCDLNHVVEIRDMLDVTGSLDLLVTSAFPFIESSNFDYGAYLEAEKILRGHVFAITHAVKTMNQGSKIINILGQCVERGLPGGTFYSGAFAFLNNWGNSINGKEGKERKLQVCSLLLGPVDTREWSGLSKEVVQRYKAKVADFISTKQVAETVEFIFNQPIVPSTYKLDAFYGN